MYRQLKKIMLMIAFCMFITAFQNFSEIYAETESVEDVENNMENAELYEASTYYWPVDTSYNITCGFYGYKNHNGVDFAVPVGTPVYASVGGTATVIDRGCLGSHRPGGKQPCSKGSNCSAWNNGGHYGSYGNYIKITQSDGVVSYYCHLKTGIPISNGATVSAGQLIGYSGCAGNTTGPHLHFEMRRGSTILNPEKYLTKSSAGIENCVDEISGHVGMVRVRGWAIDMANKTKSLQIDIYVGGPAGSSNVDIIGVMAKETRTDVGNAYPGTGNNHGFDTEIYTWRSGAVPIYVYAHNAAMTDAKLLMSKTVTITADKTPPVISEVKVTNKTKDGYTISCKVTDNGAIAEVKFPTWTVANGDDDIVWVPGTKNGNYYSANIKVSDHKNEGGTYATHIYATDKNGNKSCNTSQENIYIDRTAPVISNVKITNIDETGYTISCTATDNTSLKYVKFPTWTEKNGMDDLKAWMDSNTAYDGTKSGNTYTFRVKISAHGNERGNYITHIYAYDTYGNYTGYTTTPTTFVPNKYTVVYNANGGSGAPGSQTKWEKTTLKLSTTKPYKNYTITYNGNGGTAGSANKSVGCTFKSWNTNAAGTGTSYSVGGNYVANAGAVLYAQWQNPVAGNLASASRTGYTFDGWYTAANGGSKVTAATTITGNTTLYAHWTIIKYSVAYNANGGSGAPGSQTKEYGKALTLSSAKPYKNYTITYNGNGGTAGSANKSVGCTFKSWNTNAAGTGTAYNAGASYNANSSATLYAQWQNPTAGSLANASRTGYTFDGWYTAANGGSKVTAATTITGNTTLYAHWKALCSGVSLNYSSKTLLGKGDTLKLTGTVSPAGAINKTLSWSSSNTAVATVDSNGLVTAVAGGSATITAKTQDGSNVSATCKITVLGDKNIGDDFYAYISNTSLGKYLTNEGINVAVHRQTGNADQVWHFQRQSDNSYKITSCLNGKNLDVYCAGTADGINLQVYWDNGNKAQRWYICGEPGAYYFRTLCGKTVVDIAESSNADSANAQMWTYYGRTSQQFTIQKVNMCSGITLNYSSTILLGKGDTVKLTGTVSPNEATNKTLSWSSSNTAVATVDTNGLVTAVSEGSATITAKTQDGSNVSATCEVTVLNPLTITGTVSDSEILAGQTVTISAEATGGKGGYMYSFLIHNLENDTWYRWEFSKEAQHVWTADESGNREFFAEVKDSAGTIVRSSAMKVTVKVKEYDVPLTITGNVSKHQANVGEQVVIYAAGAGGTGDYTYSFLIHNLENDTWYRWAFDKSAEHVWTANGSGNREFFAEVKDATGTVIRSSAMNVTVKSAATPLAITGKVSALQVAAGKTVTISASATGGAGDYTYSFLIHNLENDTWYRWAFDKNAEHIWTASGSGNREFFAEVKDAAGTVVRSEVMKVTVGDGSSTGALQIQASADKNQVTTGTAVTISAAAAGGSGNYTYSFLVHNLVNDSWYRFGDFAAASSYTWTAGSAGTREFFVEAKDGNGTVVRSSAVTVVVK